jgi:hypothetical protein
MRGQIVDYGKRDHPGERIFNRGFWLHAVPRLILLCRLVGHRPVIDGVDYSCRPGETSSPRWVCCDRCGLRPQPQGALDPEQYVIGDRYEGPWSDPLPDNRASWQALKGHLYPPGPWPQRPTGTIGGQLVIGHSHGGVGVEIKIGNSGSEQVLAASVRLHHLMSLYLHTEQHGTWLQRRLNPTGYQSRVIGVGIDNGKLHWKLWAKRDGEDRGAAWWREARITIDPRDRILGPARFQYQDVGEPVSAVVRMPHGDDHEVTLQLQQVTFGRRRGRKTTSWSVDWTCGPGIATKPGDRGRIRGSGVDVPLSSVHTGQWSAVAAAAIAQRLTVTRASCGYQPVASTPA